MPSARRCARNRAPRFAASSLPRRSISHVVRDSTATDEEDVDRRVGHALLLELPLDDLLARPENRVLDREREIVHEVGDQVRLFLQRRVHLVNSGFVTCRFARPAR